MLKQKIEEDDVFRNFQKMHIMRGSYQGTHYTDIYQFNVSYKNKLVCGIFKIYEYSSDYGEYQHIYTEKMYVVDISSVKHGDVETKAFLEVFEKEDLKYIDKKIEKLFE